MLATCCWHWGHLGRTPPVLPAATLHTAGAPEQAGPGGSGTKSFGLVGRELWAV
jgi:hypothetical protein